MFEHASLNGEKYRLVATEQAFIKPDVLETREGPASKSARLQHAVAGALLVERYLPPETSGDAWPHDQVAAPWWSVVDHPPHAGIVAEFNEALGGTYKRKLDPLRNVVAFAEQGEEVIMKAGTYSVVRARDGKEISQPTLVALRSEYYAA